MGVALREIFRADVGAPLESADSIYFCGECAETVFDLFDLWRSGSLLKFE